MVYVPEAVFAANIKLPSTSTLKGPSVTGVTSLLVAVTNEPFKVSFDVTFCMVIGVVPDATVVRPSSTASIEFKTTTVAVAISQFAGLKFDPVDGLASHNW